MEREGGTKKKGIRNRKRKRELQKDGGLDGGTERD